MKGKTIFLGNLLDATKSGSVKWSVDKTHPCKSSCKLKTKIESVQVIVEIDFEKNNGVINLTLSNTWDKVHLYDRSFKGSSSIFLRSKDYSDVSELFQVLFTKYAKSYIQSNTNEQDNDNFLERVGQTMGKSFFRERRLKKILSKGKK